MTAINNQSPTLKALGARDFLFTGLTTTGRVTKIVEKIKEGTSGLSETAVKTLTTASKSLKGASLGLNVICLPINIIDLGATLQEIPETLRSIPRNSAGTNVYNLGDLALKLGDAVTNLVLTVFAIVKLAKEILPPDLVEKLSPFFTPVTKAMDNFDPIAKVIGFIMLGHLAVKIGRQAVFLIRYNAVKNNPDPLARLEFWSKHKVSLKRDAGLNADQITKIESIIAHMKTTRTRGDVGAPGVIELQNNTAVELSNLLKNRVWKKVGENSIGMTAKLLGVASGFAFGATTLTAGTSAILGCSILGASTALQISGLALKEINQRSFERDFANY